MKRDTALAFLFLFFFQIPMILLSSIFNGFCLIDQILWLRKKETSFEFELLAEFVTSIMTYISFSCHAMRIN